VAALGAAADGPTPEANVLAGPNALEEAVREARPDIVVLATPGLVALPACLAALRQGAMVALANKETLVSAGELVTCTAPEHGEAIVAVDSEHCGIWQCLKGEERTSVVMITLTSSGGAFRDTPLEDLEHATPEQALQHPTWSMGPKITVDSATLMNKGLELIEAHHLFGVPLEKIDVVVHPQSVIHSLVEFKDGSAKAQLSNPDMRLPIAFALSYPERLPGVVPPTPFHELGTLELQPLDPRR